MGKVACFSPGGGVILVVMLVCVGGVAPLLSNDSKCFQTTRKLCVDPKACCKFKHSTREFDKCCKDHGCCPTNCDEITDLVSKNCSIASSCCRFPQQSRQFKACCDIYGCCPLCEDIKTGCCYNGDVYQWGATVEHFPDLCLALVCAARTTNTAPFFAAVIVPVKLQSCEEGLACRDGLTCVDQTGLVQVEGATWYPDECQNCTCRNSTVQCLDMVQCPDQPYPHCIAVPRPCCPLWNCSVGCIDESGTHVLGSSWYSTPCLYHTCTQDGIVTRIKQCVKPEPPHPDCDIFTPDGECCPRWRCRGCTDAAGDYHELDKEWPGSDPCKRFLCTEHGIKKESVLCSETNSPHSGCFAYTPVGECCPKWNCSGCVDEKVNYHKVGDEWGTADPCIVFQCTELGVQLKNLKCVVSSPPQPGCQAYVPKGECCPKWNCSGCVDSTGPHQLFEVWHTDPCTAHLCTKTGIQTEREHCSFRPAPHPSCTKYTPPKKCCLQWNCTGCFDTANNFHEMNSEWREQDPCIIFKCTKNGITMARVNCSEVTRPHPDCSEHTPEGVCCPIWKCSTCVDGHDKHHPLYEVWKPDPCTTNFCTKSGIQTTQETCDLGPEPHPSCQIIIPLEKCCPEWSCRACSDSAGNYHEMGSEWSTEDPCLKFVCTDLGIMIKRILCTRTDRHHPSCYEYKPKGDCCFKWNCSGCVDNNDFDHPLYDLWRTDSCTTHYCTRTGTQTTRETCTLGPAPHPSCKTVTPPGECCSEWQCSACVDGGGKYHELGSNWTTGDPCLVFACTDKGITVISVQCEETLAPHPDCYTYTPKEECCPEWNCSGCFVDYKYHQLYDTWKSDPCTTHTCTADGVHTTRQECSIQPAPHPTCRKVSHEGKCCPAWECSGCLVTNVMHKVGDKWTGEDPCIEFLCTAAEIKISRINCTQQTSPHPGCSPYTPDKECCPKWNCSGCVDVGGKFHQLYDLWKTDPCVTHFCTNTGINTTRKECKLGPSPDLSCVTQQSPGDCCPRWQCRGCLDTEGKYHDLGQDWGTEDPCTRLVCSQEGITTKRVACVHILRPHPDCHEFTPLGECCPKWNCSGCVSANGTYQSLYHVWRTDQCTTQMCTKAGIQTTKQNCSLGPAPHSSCQKLTYEGKCCPEWNCRGCFDTTGDFHALGTEWPTADPCMLLVCNVAGILPKLLDCTDKIKPHPDCTKYIPLNECCSKWNCSGCTDGNGTYHPLHNVWKTDPCTTQICTRDGIKPTVKVCHIDPAPYTGCQKYIAPGDCCPQWKCSGCTDVLGAYHNLNEVWYSDPCTTQTCTNEGIKTTVKYCSLGPALHPSCQKYTLPNECCPSWKCTGCTDNNGTYRPLYDSWESDPCTTLKCTSTGIKTTVTPCDLGPAPHVDCQEYTPPGECCPEWKCRGCLDTNSILHEFGQKWSTDDPCVLLVCTEAGIVVEVIKCKDINSPHPDCSKYKTLGQCCWSWNCSGCTSDNGTYYQLHRVWKSDPCTTHKCTTDGIRTTVTDCHVQLSPHSTCQKHTTPGECCPEWRCSGCTDNEGKYHSLYDVWSSDPCKTQECTSKGINTTMKDCHLGPAPHPSCQKYTPPKECCPRWKCRGCLDSNGIFHDLGQKWKTEDPCVSLVCTKTGLVKNLTECLDSHSPHPGCFKYKPLGECCSKWNCSGCIDSNETYHSLHKVWKSDVCTAHRCTSDGIKTKVNACYLGPAPFSSCEKYTYPAECCPRWKCSGCMDTLGTYHPLHDVWESDSCTTHECESYGIITTVRNCEDTPAPHDSCQKYTPEGACCPQWECSGCRDFNGTYHKFDEEWATDLCTKHKCSREGIKTTVEKCQLGPAPHTSCHKHAQPGDCCPKWKCSGCADNGTYHPLYEVWSSDPCTTHVCTSDGINTTVQACEERPAPRGSCRKHTLPGECCPAWKCGGCLDEEGHTRKEKENWNKSTDPCMKCSCDGHKVTCVKVQCAAAPDWPCDPPKLPGQCCPHYCPRPSVSTSSFISVILDGCVDENGTRRKYGEKWVHPSDTCREFQCGRMGTITSVKRC